MLPGMHPTTVPPDEVDPNAIPLVSPLTQQPLAPTPDIVAMGRQAGADLLAPALPALPASPYAPAPVPPPPGEQLPLAVSNNSPAPTPTALATPGPTGAPAAGGGGAAKHPAKAAGPTDLSKTLGTQAELSKEEQASIAAQGALKGTVAEQDKANADLAAAAGQAHQERLGKAIEEGNQHVEKSLANYDSKVKEYEGQKLHGYFEGGRHNLIAAKIGLALGAFGAGLSAAGGMNTGNVAQQQLNKLIDDDFQKQRANIEKVKDSVAMARTGVLDAREAKQTLLQDVNAKEAAMWKTVELQGVAQLKAFGKQQADIDANGLIIQARQKQEELRAQTVRQSQQDYLHALQVKSQVAENYAQAAHARAAAANAGQDKKDKAQAALDARVVRDPNGNPIGIAATPRVVDKIASDIAATDSYVAKVNALADHIRQHGRILNPYSAEGKERASLAADVQSAGRQVSGIQASDAGQKLEHEMIGGSGVLAERMANPDTLVSLAKRAQERTVARLQSSLAPLPDHMKAGKTTIAAPGGGGAAAPAAEAPKGQVVQVRDKKTGAMIRAYRMPDGRLLAAD